MYDLLLRPKLYDITYRLAKTLFLTNRSSRIQLTPGYPISHYQQYLDNLQRPSLAGRTVTTQLAEDQSRWSGKGTGPEGRTALYCTDRLLKSNEPLPELLRDRNDPTIIYYKVPTDQPITFGKAKTSILTSVYFSSVVKVMTGLNLTLEQSDSLQEIFDQIKKESPGLLRDGETLKSLCGDSKDVSVSRALGNAAFDAGAEFIQVDLSGGNIVFPCETGKPVTALKLEGRATILGMAATREFVFTIADTDYNAIFQGVGPKDYLSAHGLPSKQSQLLGLKAFCLQATDDLVTEFNREVLSNAPTGTMEKIGEELNSVRDQISSLNVSDPTEVKNLIGHINELNGKTRIILSEALDVNLLTAVRNTQTAMTQIKAVTESIYRAGEDNRPGDPVESDELIRDPAEDLLPKELEPTPRSTIHD